MSGSQGYRPVWLSLAFLSIISPTRIAAQVPFREALKLAAKHSAPATETSVYRDQFAISCQDAEPTLLRTSENSIWAGSLDLSTIQSTRSDFDFATQPLLMNSSIGLQSARSKSQAPVVPREYQRGHAVLCTAIAYAKLTNVNSQMDIVRRQEAAADRLLKIEVQRVVKRIDNPVVLTRAKLLAARTRVWAAELDAATLQLHRQLAVLTGLPEEQIELVANSIPPLLDLSTADIDMQPSVRQVIAARDVAQLEQVLARTERMRTRGKEVVGKANLGDLLAANIAENEKLLALLEMNFAFESAKLQILEETGRLGNWAEGIDPESEQSIISQTIAPKSLSEIPTTSPLVRSIMITPGVSALSVGQSQQFSAIAIYSTGSARNATSEAVWQCSSNSDLIVSTSGLVTALALSEVTLTANFGGISQSRQIKITADDSMSLNP